MATFSTQSASTLRRIGWQGDLPALADGHMLARVSAQHRAGYEVHDGERAFNAQPAPKFLKRNLDPSERPAVGDFVVIETGAPPHIVDVLPRRGVLERAAAGERYARQIIASINFRTIRSGKSCHPHSWLQHLQLSKRLFLLRSP